MPVKLFVVPLAWLVLIASGIWITVAAGAPWLMELGAPGWIAICVTVVAGAWVGSFFGVIVAWLVGFFMMAGEK